VTVLEGVTASVPEGGCTAVVGPNGAGKTTLLLALLGFVPYRGRIDVACEPEGCSPRIGYVPQRFQFDAGLPMTVLEFMIMGPQRAPLWSGLRRNHLKRARELLAEVGADALEKRPVGTLSGGEMQRALLALALQQDPDLLVLDEPAAGVDFRGEYLFCEILDRLRAEHDFTQLMVSHDLATVTHHATHVILLNRHVAAEGKPKAVLTPDNLSAVFGQHMGLVAMRGMPEAASTCTAPCCREVDHD